MSRSDRKHERHATLVEVRFASAAEFVTEYAENLSAGGLFVRNAHNLEPLSEVQVQIHLPGYAVFEVTARVAHLLDETVAARFKREPGAGLQLIDVPQGFDAALMEYLSRLGKRRDRVLLVEDPACQSLLETAGFRTQSTQLGEVLEQLGETSEVLAVIVHKASAGGFRERVAEGTSEVPVIGCDIALQEQALLTELDRLFGLL